jgi:single-strand DNA-binding protein
MSASPTTLVGNITQDPEIRYLGDGGAAKLSFSIAVNHFWTDQSGDRQEKTSFFNCVAWRNLAEDAAAVLEKGVRVVVTGRLEQRSFEDKDGNSRSTVELLADEIAISARAIESFSRKRRDAGDGGQSRGGQKRVPTRSSAPARSGGEEVEPF